jgi:lauroyl/myristoyl acyltransferase
MLAARTRAPIVPVVCRRLPNGHYEARHYEPIEVANDSPAETLRVTRLIAAAVEDMIAVAPEQWYSFKPMWPDTPAEKQALAERATAMESES